VKAKKRINILLLIMPYPGETLMHSSLFLHGHYNRHFFHLKRHGGMSAFAYLTIIV